MHFLAKKQKTKPTPKFLKIEMCSPNEQNLNGTARAKTGNEEVSVSVSHRGRFQLGGVWAGSDRGN